MKKSFCTLFAMMLAMTGVQAQTITDEYETYDENDDVIYRHVVNYNAAKERASETIYKKEKQYDGTWSAERRVDRGVYSYEYDSRGRLSMKQVKYENDELDSYRIYVTYNNDETIYTHYKLDYDDERFYRIWGVYPTGEQSLASVNDRDSYNRNYLRYDRQGNVIEQGYVERSYNGEEILLKPERTYYDASPRERTVLQWYDGMENSGKKYYHYADNGNLLEYSKIWKDYCDDKYRIVFTYDDLGRILTKSVYEAKRIDDGDSESETMQKVRALYPGDDDIEGKYRWQLSETEEYTYATNEVYDVTNGWYNEFGFCGPIASCKLTTYDYYNDEVETEEVSLIAKRDASGKLLSFEYVTEYIDEAPTITIDENGHVVKVLNYYEDYSYYDNKGNYLDEPVYRGYSKDETNYSWQGENLVRVDVSSEYYDMTWMDKPETYSSFRTYSYSKGKIEVNDGDSNKTIEKDGNRVKLTNPSNDDIFLIDKQTEDVRFALLRPFEESRELGLDSIRVLSRKDRVVHVSNYDYSDYYDKFLSLGNSEMGYMLQPNLSAKDYFRVECQGNLAYCYDIEDNLRYIVDGERLWKEFIYEEKDMLVPVESPKMSNGDGSSIYCTTIEYLYDENGNLVGITSTTKDGDGNITENYTLTYTYDTASGIQSITTAPGFHLNGRSLGTDGDISFSIYDVNGRAIATSVSNFTFAQPGVYMMKIGEKATKIYVK